MQTINAFKPVWVAYGETYGTILLEQTKCNMFLDQPIEETVFRAYLQKGRFYHGISHIFSMLSLFESVKHRIHDPTTVELAIWFHDIVYDPYASDNEEKSAQVFANSSYAHNCGEKTTNKIIRFILATKNHHAVDNNENLDSTELEDLKIFLDLDLSILGKSRFEYSVYAHNIKREYCDVEDFIYLRVAFLEKMKKSGKIFHTDLFDTEVALRNIEWEITFLNKQVAI